MGEKVKIKKSSQKVKIFKILGKKSKNLRTPKDRVANPSYFTFVFVIFLY